jgi:hypothetical protein
VVEHISGPGKIRETKKKEKGRKQKILTANVLSVKKMKKNLGKYGKDRGFILLFIQQCLQRTFYIPQNIPDN